MRLENEPDWEGVQITQTVETGDFFPTNNIWDQTLIRRVKVTARRITENHQLAISHFSDTYDFVGVYVGWREGDDVDWMDTGDVGWAEVSLTALELSLDTGASRLARKTQPTNLLGWSHRLHFEVASDETKKALQLINYGIEFRIVRRDY